MSTDLQHNAGDGFSSFDLLSEPDETAPAVAAPEAPAPEAPAPEATEPAPESAIAAAPIAEGTETVAEPVAPAWQAAVDEARAEAKAASEAAAYHAQLLQQQMTINRQMAERLSPRQQQAERAAPPPAIDFALLSPEEQAQVLQGIHDNARGQATEFARREISQLAATTRFEMSEANALRDPTIGPEVVAAAKAWVQAQGDGVGRQLSSQPDPIRAAVDTMRRVQAMEKLGTDPEAAFEAEVQRRMAARVAAPAAQAAAPRVPPTLANQTRGATPAMPAEMRGSFKEFGTALFG